VRQRRARPARAAAPSRTRPARRPAAASTPAGSSLTQQTRQQAVARAHQRRACQRAGQQRGWPPRRAARSPARWMRASAAACRRPRGPGVSWGSWSSRRWRRCQSPPRRCSPQSCPAYRCVCVWWWWGGGGQQWQCGSVQLAVARCHADLTHTHTYTHTHTHHVARAHNAPPGGAACKGREQGGGRGPAARPLAAQPARARAHCDARERRSGGGVAARGSVLGGGQQRRVARGRGSGAGSQGSGGCAGACLGGGGLAALAVPCQQAQAVGFVHTT
jgi:hypothetical protein